MTRREAAGLLMLFAAVLAGRWVRHALLVDADGAWREPGFLDGLLPPLVVEAPAPEPPAPPFHVNRTTADTLTYLPGVGDVLAGRIVAERERGGPFRAAADLRRVKGIGPKLVERLGPLLLYDAPAASARPPASSSGHAGR
jgi:competence ComEA-like helix-hairpin-helix protein